MALKFDNRFISKVLILFFAVVVISSIADIFSDLEQGAKTSHIIQEVIITVFSLVLLIASYRNARTNKRKNKMLLQKIDEVTAIADRISAELLKAKKIFGEEIVKQFSTWQFTESESEVALFTLKGFNSKEIAHLRNASEKTVRNQLTSIYSKAGLNGKHAFISWFMDGLL